MGWGIDEKTIELYRRRVAGETAEMGCAKQLHGLIGNLAKPGMTVLDVGCGSGYFYLTLKKLGLEYYGIDPTEAYITLGREYLAGEGLRRERLKVGGIGDIVGTYDFVVCFNVIQHLEGVLEDHIRVLCDAAKTALFIRTSLRDESGDVREYGIDDAHPELRFLTICYAKDRLVSALERRGFDCEFIADEYTAGKPEKPYSNDVFFYPWMAVARRKEIR